MDKQFRMTYRLPERFRQQVSDEMKSKDWGDADLLNAALEQYFNPPKPEVIDHPVVVNIEGITVDSERMIVIDEKIFEVFNSRKLSSMSMQDYANNFMWEKLENSRRWMEQNRKPISPYNGSTTPPNLRDEQSQFGQSESNNNIDSNVLFNEYTEAKRECENDDDWKKLQKKIKEDSQLNDFQRSKLLRTIGR